jgi:hypothetical protein
MTTTQKNKSYFNHPVYISILIKWFYGPTGITQHFPHRFGPMFPLPAKAIVATIVCIITDFYSLLVMTFVSDWMHIGGALDRSSMVIVLSNLIRLSERNMSKTTSYFSRWTRTNTFSSSCDWFGQTFLVVEGKSSSWYDCGDTDEPRIMLNLAEDDETTASSHENQVVQFGLQLPPGYGSDGEEA